MSFGFRLTVNLGPTDTLTSDSEDREFDLGAAVGVVAIKGPLNDLPKRPAALMITGKSYPSDEAARAAGRILKDALRAAAAASRIAVDVGEDLRRGGPGQILIDDAAKRGIQLLPDVHGLIVFEESGHQVLTLRGSAHGVNALSLDEFVTITHRYVSRDITLTDRQKLAIDLFSQSRAESSARSRHLTLVTALEVLSPRSQRQGLALQLVDEFEERVKRALTQAREEKASGAEVDELQSLATAAKDLRKQSIGSSIRSRVEALASSQEEGQANRSLANKIYSARSDLGHTGRTQADLNQFLIALEAWVVTAALEDNKSEEAISAP